MKYSIRKNWFDTFETLSKNPAIFTPFIIIAFLESIALEIAYFSTRPPLSSVFAPIIKKFFGESFAHYPGNLILLPRLFYFAQMVIYAAASVLLAAIAIQIFINIRTGHPIIFKAIIKNVIKRYAAFAGYGLIYLFLMYLLDRGEGIAALKAARYISRHFFQISTGLYSIGITSLSFLTFVIVQTLLTLTVPVLIVEKKLLLKAMLESISIGARNFLRIFCLILVPLLFYLPMILMKTFLAPIINKTFPEVSFFITLLGIVTSVFIDTFVIISLTQFLLDTKKTE